jgi:hypothetical protein
MKTKLLSILFLAFFVSGVVVSQTIHDPNITPTITSKQIKALGQQNVHKGPTVVLNFEGLGDQDEILNFYNGGTSSLGYSGTNYGVQFLGNTLSIIDEDAGGSGNFANEPSPSTIMFFLTGPAAGLNVPAGFSTGFSFYYCSAGTGSVEVYDGLDGTGTLLASLPLPANFNVACTGDPTGTYCHWDAVGVTFSGTAKSVIFNGVANECGFDNITFGTETPGGPGPSVPVSNWALYFGIFLMVTFIGFRFIRMR